MRAALLILLLSGCASGPYWTKDPGAWKTERTTANVTPYATKWCAGAWGCAQRTPPYYAWDYHITGEKKPSECVAIVDARLPLDLQEKVREHELCHCKGYTHPKGQGRFVRCPS